MSHRASRGSQGGSRADMSISSTPEGPEVGNRSPWPRPQDYICRLIVSSLHVFPTWPTEERASCDIFHPLGQCYGGGSHHHLSHLTRPSGRDWGDQSRWTTVLRARESLSLPYFLWDLFVPKAKKFCPSTWPAQ